jgi:hypothetical protein
MRIKTRFLALSKLVFSSKYIIIFITQLKTNRLQLNIVGNYGYVDSLVLTRIKINAPFVANIYL